MTNNRLIAFIENDESLLEIYNHPSFAQRLRSEGLPYEVCAFRHVDELRALIQEGNSTIMCLVADLSGVGWGGLQKIPEFRDRERVNFPVIVSTGMNTEFSTSPEGREWLVGEKILILSKMSPVSVLITEIKKLICETDPDSGIIE